MLGLFLSLRHWRGCQVGYKGSYSWPSLTPLHCKKIHPQASSHCPAGLPGWADLRMGPRQGPQHHQWPGQSGAPAEPLPSGLLGPLAGPGPLGTEPKLRASPGPCVSVACSQCPVAGALALEVPLGHCWHKNGMWRSPCTWWTCATSLSLGRPVLIKGLTWTAQRRPALSSSPGFLLGPHSCCALG